MAAAADGRRAASALTAAARRNTATTGCSRSGPCAASFATACHLPTRAGIHVSTGVVVDPSVQAARLNARITEILGILSGSAGDHQANASQQVER
jgi:hypothetical protein